MGRSTVVMSYGYIGGSVHDYNRDVTFVFDDNEFIEFLQDYLAYQVYKDDKGEPEYKFETNHGPIIWEKENFFLENYYSVTTFPDVFQMIREEEAAIHLHKYEHFAYRFMEKK